MKKIYAALALLVSVLSFASAFAADVTMSQTSQFKGTMVTVQYRPNPEECPLQTRSIYLSLSPGKTTTRTQADTYTSRYSFVSANMYGTDCEGIASSTSWFGYKNASASSQIDHSLAGAQIHEEVLVDDGTGTGGQSFTINASLELEKTSLTRDENLSTRKHVEATGRLVGVGRFVEHSAYVTVGYVVITDNATGVATIVDLTQQDPTITVKATLSRYRNKDKTYGVLSYGGVKG